MLESLSTAELRCEIDLSGEKIGAKIAKAHEDKIPYMLVIGPKEAQSKTVNVRMRGRQQSKTVSVEEFLKITDEKIADKSIDLSF